MFQRLRPGPRVPRGPNVVGGRVDEVMQDLPADGGIAVQDPLNHAGPNVARILLAAHVNKSCCRSKDRMAGQPGGLLHPIGELSFVG